MSLAVIIAGGRDFANYNLLHMRATDIISKYDTDDVTIISGHARGADTLGEQFAVNKKYDLEIFPANWERYGTQAGYFRNKKMADRLTAFSDKLLIACWDGKSPGTKMMIDIAKKMKIPTEIIKY